MMKNRILGNWKSSLFGVVCFAIATFMLYKRIITFNEWAIFMPTVAGWLWVQDSAFKLNPKKE